MKKIEAPDISVLMSIYNGKRFVSEAINSILNQSLTNFEFIILDDGSTDGVTEDLMRYADADRRIRLIVQDNIGLTKSLNCGLALSRGQFIARMDADDISHPSRFALQVKEFKRDRKLVLLGSEVELVTECGIELGTMGKQLSHKDIRAQLLNGDGSALVHPAVMFRRDAALAIGGYDEAFTTAQDLDLFLRLTDSGKAANLPQTLLKWRQHYQSVNRTRSETWADAKTRAIAKTINRIGVDAYAKQKFAAERLFSFPSSDIELADFAWINDRPSQAVKLYYRELAHGPEKLRAIKGLTKATVRRLAGRL
jgi:glycosyltransferase involved in cell wall biosynthesis